MISASKPEATPIFAADIDRPIVNADGKSVRHLIVTIRTPRHEPAATSDRLPLNLGLVIDASGSMQGPPLDAAKAAALDVVNALPDTDHMTLVSFANDVQHHATAEQLDRRGRKTIERALRQLVTRGSTNLADGWLAGCETVAERQAALTVHERNHVVLLSDGHANAGETDPRVLAIHASELRRRGIVTSTVGVGHAYSPTQLQAIAEAGGGRMHDAEEPHDIAQIVMAELNDTLGTVVENLELGLRLPAGAKAELYGTAPVTPTARGLDVLVGSMLGGATRQVVIKVRLPAGDVGAELGLGLTARWTVPGDGARFTCDVAVPPLRFDSAAACLAQPRDIARVKTVVEQWVAHVYYRSMVLNQDGEVRAAQRFVDGEAKYLERYCAGIPELEEIVNGLDGYGRSVSRAYSASTSKEVMLQAYKTSRGELNRRARATLDYGSLSSLEEAIRRGESH